MDQPPNNRILADILDRMKKETGSGLDINSRIMAGITYRIGEIIGDDRGRLPQLQTSGDNTPGDIPTHWWNWFDMTVGYTIDNGYLVVFEMKTTAHILSEESCADHLMELIDYATSHAKPCQEL